jgi:hypothetical protein
MDAPRFECGTAEHNAAMCQGGKSCPSMHRNIHNKKRYKTLQELTPKKRKAVKLIAELGCKGIICYFTLFPINLDYLFAVCLNGDKTNADHKTKNSKWS